MSLDTDASPSPYVTTNITGGDMMRFVALMVAAGIAIAFAVACLVPGSSRTPWDDVEKRYDVTVLDKNAPFPRAARRTPVVVAMEVQGVTRQCSAQVVGADVMVFCGEDAVEAPRR
jgi:hypothetical protein